MPCVWRETDNAVAKSLPDGSIVGLQSREYALFCEAKYVLAMKTKEKRRAYLDLVEQKRGVDGKNQLAKEIMRWWNVEKQSISESGSEPTVSTLREGGRNTSSTR